MLVADVGPSLTGDQDHPAAWLEPVESPLHLRAHGTRPIREPHGADFPTLECLDFLPPSF